MNTAPKDAEAVPLPESEEAVVACEDCNGHGLVGDAIPQGEFQPPEYESCNSCMGTGRWKVQAISISQCRAYGDACRADERALKEQAQAEAANWKRWCKELERARLAAQPPAPSEAEILEVWGRYDEGVDTRRALVDRILARWGTPPTHAQVDAAPHDSAETRDAALGLPMDTAPKDGTLIRLRVMPDREAFTAFDDSMGAQWTVGFNQLKDTGEDRWQFAGWSWEQDCIIEGQGEPVGWLPMLAAPSAPTASPASMDDAWSTDRAHILGALRAAGFSLLKTGPSRYCLAPAVTGTAARTAPEAMADGPMTEAPEVGAKFWFVGGGGGGVTLYLWQGDTYDRKALEAGRCYTTRAAALHSLAKGA